MREPAETFRVVNLGDDPHYGDAPRRNDYPRGVLQITSYTSGSYEGSGVALTINSDGTCTEEDLGHCSCYGPFEQGSEEFDSLEDWLQGSGPIPRTGQDFDSGAIGAIVEYLRREKLIA